MTDKLAERAGFEPARALTDSTRFPGVPVQPLQHLSAERVGFEPTVPHKETPLFESDALNRSATSPKRR